MVMVSALFYLQLISNYPGMINSLSAHFPMILAWFSLQHLVWKKTSNNELWFMRCGKLLNLHCIVVDYRAKSVLRQNFPWHRHSCLRVVVKCASNSAIYVIHWQGVESIILYVVILYWFQVSLKEASFQVSLRRASACEARLVFLLPQGRMYSWGGHLILWKYIGYKTEWKCFNISSL